MRIGTFARTNHQVREALRHEPDFVDLRMDLNFSIAFNEAKADLNEHSTPCTLHLPSNPDWKPLDLSQGIVPYVDIARQIDVELVTIHTTLSTLFYNDEDIDTFLDAVGLACDASAALGIPIAIETLGVYYAELALLFDKHPSMKMALDIGHGQIMATRNRALGHIDSFFERIAMVNVHDNHGQQLIDEVLVEKKKRKVSREELRELANRYDTHLPIGEGSIDFSPIFKELKEKEYTNRFLLMCSDPFKFPEEREKFLNLWRSA